ncbi:MAG: hypothetical protein AAGG07_09130 [Planctomycetota bacterium]
MDRDSRVLVEWLRDTDAACPACGYSLRDLRATTCPECGYGLRLTLSVNERGIRGWVLGIIGCAGAIGFDLVTIAFFLTLLVLRGQPTTAGGRTFVTALSLSLLVPGVICIAVLWWMLTARARFLAMRNMRPLLAGGSLCAMIVALHGAIGLAWLTWIL